MNEEITPRDEVAANRDHAALNLLRMRGELEQARQFGTAVLKKHPNDPALYELMGEIHMDLREEDQALNWFEMALDLDPSLATVRDKVEGIKSRLAEKDHSETVERLGLPTKSPFPWLVLGVTSIAAVALVFGAFHVGKNAGKETQPVVSPPVALSSPKEEERPETSGQDIPQQPEESIPSPAGIALDQALLSRLTSSGNTDVRFVDALHDPRGPSCHVTVGAIQGQGHPATALKAALAVNQARPDFTMIHVRVSDGGSIVYAATVRQDTLSTVASALAGGDSIEKQAEVALADPWPSDNSNAASGGAAGTPGD
ncbi:MAG: type IV pilus biogenesis/stability protein PilW [Fimbriimonadaceae bacterium]